MEVGRLSSSSEEEVSFVVRGESLGIEVLRPGRSYCGPKMMPWGWGFLVSPGCEGGVEKRDPGEDGDAMFIGGSNWPSLSDRGLLSRGRGGGVAGWKIGGEPGGWFVL